MFYDLFLELCREKGVAPTRAALDIGLSKSSPTTWKKRGLTPQGGTINKLADYFHVSADYLLGNVSDPSFHLDNERILREINSYGDETDAEKTPTPVSESGRPVNIVKIAGRDGSYAEKRLTDEQVKALQTIIDQMPDAPDDL